jgi:large subunit ribosomal protein L16
MLQPKRLKYPKSFRGKRRGKAYRGSEINFGDYGLKSLTVAWVTEKQIEAARKAIVHHTKRQGKMWLRIFPDKSYTHKPAEVRMGSGKGDVEGYVAVVKPGKMLFEIGGVTEAIAREALRLASHKLPVRTQIIARED